MILAFGEDTSESSLIFGDGIGGDQEVVHIDMEPSFVEFLSEDLVHHRLECGRRVTKAKEHDKGFETTAICDEGRFPLIALFDPNIVISPANIELGEDLRVLDFVYEF